MDEKSERDFEQGQEGGVEDAAVSGGLFPSLIDIFLDPSKVFKRIEGGLQWWKGFIVLSVIQIIIAWFMIDVNRAVILLDERGMGADQVEAMAEQMDKFAWVGLILAPIGILVVMVIVAGLVNLIVNLVSAKSDFKKLLSLVLFTGLIGSLEQIINVVIIYVKGIGSIESRADTMNSIGPKALMPEAEGFVAALLQSLSVFQIWYFIVFLIGLSAIFKISKGKAFVPTFILWLLGLAFAFLGQMFSSGMG